MQMKRVREYFYGSPKFELVPYTSSVSFYEIAVRRIAESTFSLDYFMGLTCLVAQ